jgi:hypothetical protein
MLDPIMNVCDCGPFPPILSEAGGYFGDWQGKRTIYGNESIATTEFLLEEVLELISGEKSQNQAVDIRSLGCKDGKPDDGS